MKHFTLSVFFFLLGILNINAQASRDVLALDYNSKNCILQKNDGNFFIGGAFKTPYPPFITTKMGVVNNNITENYSLTNIGFFGDQNVDQVYAVEKDNQLARNPYTYVGGDFYHYSGVYVNGLMRITNDGSIDPTFTLNNGTNPIKPVKVRALALQSNDKLIVGGSFTSYLGAAKNRIVRLESNGTVDNTFNIGTGFNGDVYCVKIQSDGKIIVGGNFTSFNGVSRSRIARLNSDGSLDSTFNINYTVDKIVRTVLIQPDGKVIIGGDFSIAMCTMYQYPTGECITTYKFNRIARLNSNGILDNTFGYLPTFRYGDEYGFEKIFSYDGSNIASVRTISEYSPGKYFIGGDFDSHNGVSRNNICLLDTTGTLETSFNPSPGPDGGVLGSIVEPSGNVVIVGGFWKFNSVIKNGVARVSPAGVALKMSNESSAEQVSVASLERELNKNEDQLTGLKVFPNPTDNILNINSERIITKISLTDLNGRIVKEINQNKTTHSVLDISELAKGIYLMQINTENESITKKIIKR